MGNKIFVLGVTVAICIWAFSLPIVLSIVAAVFAIIGCILMFLDK